MYLTIDKETSKFMNINMAFAQNIHNYNNTSVGLLVIHCMNELDRKDLERKGKSV